MDYKFVFRDDLMFALKCYPLPCELGKTPELEFFRICDGKIVYDTTPWDGEEAFLADAEEKLEEEISRLEITLKSLKELQGHVKIVDEDGEFIYLGNDINEGVRRRRVQDSEQGE